MSTSKSENDGKNAINKKGNRINKNNCERGITHEINRLKSIVKRHTHEHTHTRAHVRLTHFCKSYCMMCTVHTHTQSEQIERER